MLRENPKLRGMLDVTTLHMRKLITFYFFIATISSVNSVMSSGGSISSVQTHSQAQEQMPLFKRLFTYLCMNNHSIVNMYPKDRSFKIP